MLKYTRWIFAGLMILTLSLVSCKLISVEQQAVNVLVTIEHTFNVHPPNQTSDHSIINTADYWPEGFEGWSIQNSDLTDIQFTVSGVSTAERNVSGNFIVRFTVTNPPPTANNQLLGTTQTLTLGEIFDTPMTVWNDKVTIDPTGKAALLSAVAGKKTIDLMGATQSASGEAEFGCVLTVKVQLSLVKN
jgi:hypothetical protein